MSAEVNYPDNVVVVSSREELLTCPFTLRENVILWPRDIPRGFEGLAAQFREYVKENACVRVSEPISEINVGADHPTVIVNTREISWDVFDAFANSPPLSSASRCAARFIKKDRNLFRKPELRIHWSRTSINQDIHLDGSYDREYGRMLTCYTSPTTRGWKPDQQLPISNSAIMTFLKKGEEYKSFQFGVGHIWRHACRRSSNEISEEGISKDDPTPFVHQAGVPQGDIPRMIMLN